MDKLKQRLVDAQDNLVNSNMCYINAVIGFQDAIYDLLIEDMYDDMKCKQAHEDDNETD